MITSHDFECSRCGKCCLAAGPLLQATPKDMARWKLEGRWDILQYIDPYGYDLWFYPRGHKLESEVMDRCPFLRKLPNKDIYKCRIHDTKPEECSEYTGQNHCLKGREM